MYIASKRQTSATVSYESRNLTNTIRWKQYVSNDIIYISTCLWTHVHMCTHVYMYTHIHIHVHIHSKYTYAYTYTHTRTHTHTRTRTHTHM